MNSTKNIVSKLKEAKKAAGLSYQDIVDLTAQNGAPVSLSTVKRVFADDARECDFRYDSTLQPIAQALGVKTEPMNEMEDEEVTAALAMLKENYEARIADLRAHILSLRRDKLVLGIVVLAMFIFILYLFADGLHGNWGIFQYPVA